MSFIADKRMQVDLDDEEDMSTSSVPGMPYHLQWVISTSSLMILTNGKDISNQN